VAIENFKPEIWSARIFSTLEKELVYGNRCSREYEGEIRGGGSVVKINEIADISVSSYTSTVSISPSELTGAQKELVIDQQKYFAFQVDDIDAVQSKPKVMDEAMRKSAYALRDNADQYIASLYTEAGVTSNLGTSASHITLGSTNGFNYLAQVNKELDEKNVPRAGRWMIIPPWFHMSLIIASYGNLANQMQDQIVREGFIGNMFGLDLYVSNNVSTDGTEYRMLAGVPGAIAFVSQIMKVEAFRPESTFAEAVKGLYVYGAKVVRPNALACLTAEAGDNT
jgi:hypothetical protein